MLVVEGGYTLLIESRRIRLGPGQEYIIPQGLPHGGEGEVGTRTIHAFGGRRAEREAVSDPASNNK